MTTRTRKKNINKIRSDLEKLIKDGEQLLKEEGETISNEAEKIFDQLSEALEAAKECCGDFEEKAVDSLQTVDKSVHGNPYVYVGAACGVGFILGLLMRKSDD